MSKKGGTTPDPYATSAAQTQSNQQTANYNAALNRVDQYTPYGSSVYSVTGTDQSGAPSYRQDVTLTPLAQQELENEQRQDATLSNLGFGLADKAGQALATGVSTNGLPALSAGPQAGAGMFSTFQGEGPQATNTTGYNQQLQSGYGSGGPIQTGVPGGGPVQSHIQGAGPVQNRIQGAGPLASHVSAGPMQNSLDYSRLNPLGTDFNGAAQNAANASYAQATSRLDPQWGNSQAALDSRLANQGIVQGSEAYQKAEDEFGRNRNDAYNQANYSAQAAGLAAQAQGYNQALSTRQQGQNEVDTAGNFTNAAQAQAFGQGQQNAALMNSAQGQRFGQNAQQAGFANQAQAQQFGQNTQQADFANAAQAQRFGQGVQAGTFANAAQAQANQQNQQAAQFYNQAQGTGFDQALASANLYNQGQQQNLNTWLATQGFNNQAAQQLFQNQQASAAAGNAARAQGLQEQATLATLPLNQLNALRSGTQITNPSFTSVPQSTMGQTDVAGNIYKSAQMQAANSNNFMNGLFSMGAAALSNPAVFASDRRLKRDIVRVGETPLLKAPLYLFRYLWSEAAHIGVMAQDMLDIRPEAVVSMPGGYFAVDYSQVL